MNEKGYKEYKNYCNYIMLNTTHPFHSGLNWEPQFKGCNSSTKTAALVSWP